MPNYQTDEETIRDFLEHFQSKDEGAKYMDLLQEIANRTKKVLEIDLSDILEHNGGEELVENIVGNTKRYVDIFFKAADAVMPPSDFFGQGALNKEDLLREMRADGIQLQENEGMTAGGLPPSLTRRYEVVFLSLPKTATLPLRKVGAKFVGKLVTCKGVVVRCTDVKPQCAVATYSCNKCGCESYQEVTGREYMPLQVCASKDGQSDCKGQPVHQPKRSKFVKFQEVKLQEPAGDVPQGSVPRTLTVHVKGELTRNVKPGEMVTFSGIYLPVPFTGYKAMRAGLLTQTYLEAMHITKEKNTYEDAQNNAEDIARVKQLLQNSDGNVYGKLAGSIAPEIYGHEDVKKVLLLMMVGGVTKVMPDGMRLRGDIHVCLMGDPGVAKSQLLKQVATISPRSVYTTGKGSSGVGLTAAVQRDPTTGEMVLEGGALVLADKGICCIDEFDKMEEQDRTSIHEAMEQQTVSIAKGGITTTLNTRTTILAAANPAGGSYDPTRTPEDNINLPAALLSRFDFLWLLLDKPDEESDRMLAEHVLRVHRTKNHLGKTQEEMDEYENNPQNNDPLPASTVRAYIAMSRQYNPCVPEDLANDVAEIYTNMRQNAKANNQVVTARQLLSVLRMAQAVARLRCEEFISRGDLDEAQRLLTASKASLSTQRTTERTDTVSAIYGRIATYMLNRKQYIKDNNITRLCFGDIKEIVRNSNFPCSDAQIKQALTEYAELGVFQLDPKHFDILLHDIDDDNRDVDDFYSDIHFPRSTAVGAGGSDDMME